MSRRPQVCVVVWLGSASPSQLDATLQSLAGQRADALDLGVVLTGSADRLATVPATGAAQLLAAPSAFSGKRQAAEATDADFVLFLNAGDQLGSDCLQLCAAALAKEPSAGWAAPTRIESAPWQRELPPASAVAEQSALCPVYAPGVLYRRPGWLQASSQRLRALPGVPIYDEWHVRLVLASRGWTEVPVAAAEYRCDPYQLDMINTPAKVHLLGVYQVLSSNLTRTPLLREGIAQARSVSPSLSGWGRGSVLERVQAAALRATGEDGVEVNLGGRLATLALARPARFAAEFLDSDRTLTLAEIRCGFASKPDLRQPVSKAAPRSGRTILFAHTQRTIGGSEGVLQRWLRAAADLGSIRVVEVAERPDRPNANIGSEFSDLAQRVQASFVTRADASHTLALMGTNAEARLLACWELICREPPQVIVISANPYLYALLPLIKRYFPETVVVDLLHNECYDHRDWFNVAYEYPGYLDKRVVVSEHWRRVLIEKFGEDPGRITVVRNVVDTGRFDPSRFDREQARANLGLSADQVALGFLGRIQYQKHPAVFLELARQLLDEPRFRLFMLGDGPDRVRLLQEQPVPPNLTWLGVSDDVPSFLVALDVAVFTSRFEGFPLASLEAGAMGTPIIAPDIVGFREQLASGELGLSFTASGRTTENAATIAQLVRDRLEEMQQLAAGTRAYVQRHHALTAPDHDLQRLLGELLAG